MPLVPRRTVIVAVVAAVIAVGGGVAVGSSLGSRVPKPEVARVPAIAAANTITETGYVSLTPCRIVSTAKTGGKVGAGKSRTFLAGGSSGFSTQGGKNGGCGVPVGASAVAVSVTALHETGNGYFTLYSNGAARPAATQVTYSKNQGTTTLVNVPVNRTTGKFTLYSSSTSDALVDVAGYYREPIAVTIAASGVILSQSGQITGVTHTSAGQYDVDFADNISSCAMSATTLGSNYNAAVTVEGPTLITVYVRALDQSTTSTFYGDAQLYVTVTC